jgi:protocatechuate 3,4-dioxygenase beta subunit
VGLDQPSFTPYHAWGPDKGSKACPVCKYGRYMGMILFVGNQPITQNTKAWLAWIEQQSLKHGQYLKGYFVYGNSRAYSKDSRQKELEQLGQELGIKQTALTCVPSLNDTASEVYLNRLHPTAENTLVMYKNGRIVYKLVNAAANPGTFVQLSRILERNRASFQIFADR